jgi:hypothetical protein
MEEMQKVHKVNYGGDAKGTQSKLWRRCKRYTKSIMAEMQKVHFLFLVKLQTVKPLNLLVLPTEYTE